METKTIEQIAKCLALAVAVLGVVSYRELPFPWNILMWLPITIGYGIWFGGLVK